MDIKYKHSETERCHQCPYFLHFSALLVDIFILLSRTNKAH